MNARFPSGRNRHGPTDGPIFVANSSGQAGYGNPKISATGHVTTAATDMGSFFT